MRKHAAALKSYVDLLESLLEKCRQEQGGLPGETPSYLQHRPSDTTGLLDTDSVLDLHDNSKVEPLTDEDDIALELSVPVRNLKVRSSTSSQPNR